MSNRYQKAIESVITVLEGYLKGNDEITQNHMKLIKLGQSMFNTNECNAQALIDIAYTHIDDKFCGKLAVAWIEDFEAIKQYEPLDIFEINAMAKAIEILKNPAVEEQYQKQEFVQHQLSSEAIHIAMDNLFAAPATENPEFDESKEEYVEPEIKVEEQAEETPETSEETPETSEETPNETPPEPLTPELEEKMNNIIKNLEKEGVIEGKKEEVEPDNSGSFPEDGVRGYPKCYHQLDSGMLGLHGVYAINLRKVRIFDQCTGEYINGEKGEDGRYYVTIEGNTYPLVNLNAAIIPFGSKVERTKSIETTPAGKVEDDSTSKTSGKSEKILGTFKIPERYNLEYHYTVIVKDARHATAERVETGETFEAKCTTKHMFLHFKIEGKYIDVDWLLKEYGIITNEMKQIKTDDDTEHIDEYGHRYVWIDFIPTIPKKKYYITDGGVVINSIDDNKPLSCGKQGYRFSPTTCKSGEANGSIQPPATTMCRRKLLAVIRDKHPGFLNVTE